MNLRPDLPVAVVVFITVAILIGTLLAYPLNPISYSAEVQKDGTSADIAMHSTIESDYIVINLALDNLEERSVFFYYDESYASVCGHGDEKSRMDALKADLKYLNVTPKIINASQLREKMIDVSSAKTTSVVIFSGALPSNIYSFDGTSISDEVLDWMTAGGALYWYSVERFGYYSAPLATDFVSWTDNQPLEKGAEKFGLEFGEGGGYASIRSEVCAILGLTLNDLTDGSAKESASVKNIGYLSDDGRCSMCITRFGTGGAVLVTGNWTADHSLSKIIASRLIDWSSYTPEHFEGKFKGAETIRLDSYSDAVYVYYGTIIPRFGQLFLL